MYLKDSVYGQIHIDQYIVIAINTPHFQRLRHLKQLGTCSYVFPSATHSRFEHSIGVYYLTHMMLQHLISRQSTISLHAQQIVCLAALCHDLGHGPFSHVFDSVLLPRLGVDISHEDISCELFKDMINYISKNSESPDAEIFQFMHKNQVFVDLVCNMIHGKNLYAFCEKNMTPETRTLLTEFKNKHYLSSLVSNSLSGLDMDRLDYLFRDAKAIGLGLTIDANRLISSAAVYTITNTRDPKRSSGELCHMEVLCYNVKILCDLSEVFHTRYRLFKILYTHKAVDAFDYLVTDVMLFATNLGIIDVASVTNPLNMCTLDDRCLYSIKMALLSNTQKKNEGWSKLFDAFTRLETRDTYKCVLDMSLSGDAGYLASPNIERKEKRRLIMEALRKYSCEDEGSADSVEAFDVNEETILIVIEDINFGKKNQNPNLYIPVFEGRTVSVSEEYLADLFKGIEDESVSQALSSAPQFQNYSFNAGDNTSPASPLYSQSNASKIPGTISKSRLYGMTDDASNTQKNDETGRKSVSFATSKHDGAITTLKEADTSDILQQDSGFRCNLGSQPNSTIKDTPTNVNTQSKIPSGITLFPNNANVGMILPQFFQEVILRVYVKVSRKTKGFDQFVNRVKTYLVQYLREYARVSNVNLSSTIFMLSQQTQSEKGYITSEGSVPGSPTSSKPLLTTEPCLKTR